MRGFGSGCAAAWRVERIPRVKSPSPRDALRVEAAAFHNFVVRDEHVIDVIGGLRRKALRAEPSVQAP